MGKGNAMDQIVDGTIEFYWIKGLSFIYAD